VLGVGYDQVERVLNGDVLLKTVLILAVLKIIATSVAYASGNAGGIFGPSLFIGAMVGASVGAVAHLLFPESTAGPGAYALVGMGTAFAGIVRTPLTSVIMIFEVTRDYTIIVPLMISNLTAFYISQRLQREPIYEALAHQDGLHLPTGAFRPLAGRLLVNAAIREPPDPLAADLTARHALERVAASSLTSWPVEDGDGLLGMVRTSALADAVHAGDADVQLGELLQSMQHGKPVRLDHVHNDQPLSQALARMGESGHTVLPVVSRANARLLLGVVTLGDVLRAYGVQREDQLPPSERGSGG
jgi:CIC family chloride channel protein